MDDIQIGQIFRRVRLRTGLTQLQAGMNAGVSQSTISRIERGHLDTISLETIRAAARALEIRIELVGRWRGGDLDRLINARHSALHEALARHLRTLPAWQFEPEVSFAIWGERGVVDVLAWNRARRMLLVIELKTAIVDANSLVGTFDRKVRLASEIARRHGWLVPNETQVSGWLIVTDSRTNRRRVDAHAAMLRAAFPADGRSIHGWLRRPRQPIRCLSFWPPSSGGGRPYAPVRKGMTTGRGPTRDTPRVRTAPTSGGIP